MVQWRADEKSYALTVRAAVIEAAHHPSLHHQVDVTLRGISQSGDFALVLQDVKLVFFNLNINSLDHLGFGIRTDVYKFRHMLEVSKEGSDAKSLLDGLLQHERLNPTAHTKYSQIAVKHFVLGKTHITQPCGSKPQHEPLILAV